MRTYVRCVFSARQLIAAGLAVAAIAGSAASPDAASAATCAGASAEPGEASRAVLARALLCAINAERHRHGLQGVRPNARLEAAARRHSRDMVARRYFEHTTPEGVTVFQRVRRAGYLRSAGRWTVGENLAWGAGPLGSARGVVRAWMHSPGHRRVLLWRSFDQVGIGAVWGAPRPLRGPAVTYTADFGVTRQ
jgi:uncharacterized protein YkwD